MSTSVWVGSTEFTQRKVFNVRFKQKLNQVGTFSFTAIKDALTSAEKNKLVPGMIIRISVGGNIRFEGYITNVTKDKSRRLWEVEGESLAGILATRTTRQPVLLRGGLDGRVGLETISASQIVQQAVFRFGGFATTGQTGWTISAPDYTSSASTWFYKYEAVPVLNHILNAARLAGWDWRVYVDDGSA